MNWDPNFLPVAIVWYPRALPTKDEPSTAWEVLITPNVGVKIQFRTRAKCGSTFQCVVLLQTVVFTVRKPILLVPCLFIDRVALAEQGDNALGSVRLLFVDIIIIMCVCGWVCLY